MAHAPALYWLPAVADWRARLSAFRVGPDWEEAIALANANLDFLSTNALDQAVRNAFGSSPPGGLSAEPVRLAVLGSSTVAHLHSAIRVGALRRGFSLTTYETEYGQYWRELQDPESGLHRFRPTCVLFSFDSCHVASALDASMRADEAIAAFDEIRARIERCWSLARDAFGCQILHQTLLPVTPPLLGNNEHRLPGSRARLIQTLNSALRDMADHAGVGLLAIDERAAQDGVRAWHDPAAWHHAKQEVSPLAAPVYGDLVARLIAAAQGRMAKCLVLDLDNTLWGGVVGDDGLEGIVLGQGSALGEAFVSVQSFAKQLARRGVILAVCSKNDEKNALEPFDKHPDMLLAREDVACFAANWNDKAANIRAIASELNIGLDALVFVDDNAFERNLVRRELPMVAVPEVPDEPALIPRCLADAGYFESLSFSEEDRSRTAQYLTNRAREVLKASATDLHCYLKGLEMKLLWRRFDRLGLQRIVQLINKTNQFNLTTRRYNETAVLEIMADPQAFGLQLRLVDKLGDNGIIGIIIGRMRESRDLLVDTWLMSCRVLGRQVELATLNLLASEARFLGATRLLGEFIPTAKNGMVRDHYARHGFALMESVPEGASQWALDLSAFEPADTFIDVREG